eukprot:436013_1
MTSGLPETMTELRILITSDIHKATGNISKLGEWLKKRKIGVNWLFSPGDFLNMSSEDQTQTEERNRGEKEIAGLLSELANINSPVFYLPGNHDPISLFQKDATSLGENSINMHNSVVELCDGLHLSGFGGSVPAYQDGKYLWEGYPYTSEQQLEEEYSELSDKIEKLNPSNLIFMTHVGPANSGTTLDRSYTGEPEVTSGSETFFNAISSKEMQARTLFYVHGHTHFAPGQCWIGKVPVINPGSLMFNRFCLVNLRHSSGKWSITGCEFHTLNMMRVNRIHIRYSCLIHQKCKVQFIIIFVKKK